MERVSQLLRKNTALAYLAYNVLTMGKQLPSVLLYLPDSGVKHLLGASVEFATNPGYVLQFVNERDPQMKHRSIVREIEEMRMQAKSG